MVAMKESVGIRVKVPQHVRDVTGGYQAVRVMNQEPIAGTGAISERVSRSLCQGPGNGYGIAIELTGQKNSVSTNLRGADEQARITKRRRAQHLVHQAISGKEQVRK